MATLHVLLGLYKNSVLVKCDKEIAKWVNESMKIRNNISSVWNPSLQAWIYSIKWKDDIEKLLQENNANYKWEDSNTFITDDNVTIIKNGIEYKGQVVKSINKIDGEQITIKLL